MQIEKHKNVLNEIENIENKLQNTLAQSNSNTEDEDTLDSYMSQITGNQVVDKLEARKYKVSIFIPSIFLSRRTILGFTLHFLILEFTYGSEN